MGSSERPIGEQSYVSLTTFRRTGEAVSTPVWVATLDERRVGVWTNATSGKAKRLAHTSRVTLRPCDIRGRVADGAPTYDGTAEVLRSGERFEHTLRRVRASYGVVGWATMTLRPSRRNDAAVVITLSEPAGQANSD